MEDNEQLRNLKVRLEEVVTQLEEYTSNLVAKSKTDDDFWEDIYPSPKANLSSDGKNYEISNFASVALKPHLSYLEKQKHDNRAILVAVADKLNGCQQEELDLFLNKEYYCIIYEPHSGRASWSHYDQIRHFGGVYFKSIPIVEKAIQLCESKYGKDFFKP